MASKDSLTDVELSRAKAEPTAARRRNFWPLLPVAFLGMMVVTQGTMLYSASGGDMGIEEDYYQKGVAWDEHMAQERENRRLGWRAVLRQEPLADGVALKVTLTDKSGAPITDAEVSLTAFANVSSGSRVRTPLALSGEDYTARIQTAQQGLWEFRFEVTRGQERFTQVVRQDVWLARAGGGEGGSLAAAEGAR
ncbi:MAG: FixH family protein [Polyangiaceae bacterium]|nr:FixH family protein [Polyangiaceae bacterium]MCW5789376.1 FixH family protein [Polyangiaceae bacterium]